MRQGNKCTKCQSADLIRIPPLPSDEPYLAIGERGMRPVAITHYVCAACGYIEQWVENMDDLPKLKEQYDRP